MQFTKPKFWDQKKKSVISLLLFPLSLITIFYNKLKYFRSATKYKIPIVCIGNVYLGGTGKTPLSLEIYKICKKIGKKPAFIKKYYNYLNDEIDMLKNYGKVFSEKSRHNCIKSLIKENFDLAILDDGFQDPSIKMNYSIVCFNEIQWIGNGLVIPAGPLRENMSALKRANCVIINGSYNEPYNNYLLKKNKKLEIFYYKYKISNYEKIKKKKYIAFAGIGNPDNFFSTLKRYKINVIKEISFPDHYNFKDNTMKNLFDEAVLNNVHLLTTEKDFYRISDKYKNIIDYTKIELDIENKFDLEKSIRNSL